MIPSELRDKVVAVTGHRPKKLDPQGAYSVPFAWKLTEFAAHALKLMRPAKVISGMAQGWDQACALAAITLEIPLVAVIPNYNQPSRWSKSGIWSQDWWEYILSQAAEVHSVNNPSLSYSQLLMKRNEEMVDRADVMLALWDGNPRGGTAMCVTYARAMKKPTVHCWNKWAKTS